jgi:pyrimidine operon attenuation protein/uracil phosphoribosyltransferase
MIKTTKTLFNESEMDRAILDVARRIVADGVHDVALVGIKTRGVPLANWLAKKIESLQHKPLDVGSLDINLYRDDLSEVDHNPVVKKSELPFAITGRGIVLVDDVLYTGRTIRAALDALIDLGRPRFVKLMVMVDRGWRELPIYAEYVAKELKTTATQNVKVRFADTDGVNEVVVKG